MPQQDVTVYVSNLPPLSIIMWSGDANAVPNGWAICDGTQGTPNLQGRFIVSAGAGYAKGSTGGLASVTLDVTQIPAHSHTIPISTGYQVPSSPSQATVATPGSTATSSVGGSQPFDNRPPYYALYYIMKLP